MQGYLERCPDWLLAGLVALTAVAVWSPTLPSAFLFDTQLLVVHGWLDWKTSDPWSTIFFSAHGGGFRPSMRGTLFPLIEWVGGAETIHRAVNLLSHALTVVLVWCAARRLGLAKAMALPVTLLFGWSPCFGMLVPWIAGRPDLHAGAAVVALFLAVSATMEPSSRAASTRGLLAVAGLTALACTTKEVVLLLPLTVPALVRCGPRARLGLWCLGLGLTATLVWLRLQLHPNSEGYDPGLLARDPTQLLDSFLGTSDVLAAFLLQAGPWEFMATASAGWKVVAAIGVTAIGGALALSCWRAGGADRVAIVLSFLVLLPTTLFLRSRLGYYVHASTALVWPLLLVHGMRLVGPRVAVAVAWGLVPFALWGTVRHVQVWNEASGVYRRAIESVRPEYDRIWDDLVSSYRAGNTPRVQWLVVEGLPAHSGPIPLFADNAPWAYLAHGFYTFFERADLATDPDFLRMHYMQLWNAPVELRDYERVDLHRFVWRNGVLTEQPAPGRPADGASAVEASHR